MDEQQIHEWIKAVFADQPAKCLDSLILALVWPDDLASQDLIVDILIRKAAQKRDRWRESEAAQQFLQGKAREAEVRDAIRRGSTRKLFSEFNCMGFVDCGP